MQADRIALLLPEVYQRAATPGSPLAALLDLMAELHAPVEDLLAGFPTLVDPLTTPDRLVPFLSRWVDLERWLDEDTGELSTGVGRLRLLVAAAAGHSQRRGTAAGLEAVLALALGVPVRVEDPVHDDAGRARPFVVRVHVPQAAREHAELVARVVADEKPAHVVAEISWGAAAPATEPELGPGPPPPPPPAAEGASPAMPRTMPPSFPPARPQARRTSGGGTG